MRGALSVWADDIVVYKDSSALYSSFLRVYVMCVYTFVRIKDLD